MNGAVQLHRVGMAVHIPTLILGVADLVHPRHRILIRLRDEIDEIPRPARQLPHDVSVLSGKVLMNEEIIHSSSATIKAARSASSLAGIARATATSSNALLRRRSSTSPNGSP